MSGGDVLPRYNDAIAMPHYVVGDSGGRRGGRVSAAVSISPQVGFCGDDAVRRHEGDGASCTVFVLRVHQEVSQQRGLAQI